MHSAIRAIAVFFTGGSGLLFALALALLLAPERMPGLARVDALLFPLSLQLLPPAAPGDAVAIVRLPTAPTSEAPLQLEAMDELAQVLPKVRSSVVWLPDEALRAATTWSADGRALQQALINANAIHGPAPLHEIAADHAWRAASLGWLGIRPPTTALLDNGNATKVPLVFSAASGSEVSSLLGFYAPANLSWSPTRGLRLADNRQLTGPDGYFYPHSSARTHGPREIPLDRLAANPLPPLLVIGAAGDPAVDTAADALNALALSTYSYSPWWSAPLDKLLVLLLLAHYLLILPRASVTTGFLLTLLIAGGLLAVQFGLQLGRLQWLALGGAQGMLLAGYPLAALAAYAAKDRRRLQQEADQARLTLARQQIRQGELEQARGHLLVTGSSRERLELLYDLAIAYERRRQYRQAREVFAACLRQDKRFRDVKERLAVLTQVAAPSSPAAGALTSASTLVMPHAVEKPVLGRYRLEREIGRGAMGVVYLGTDPKISRNVAIKTLDMAQLPQDEAQEFKERFFREAEAAGRLNHPAIVTIYDVGEEGELAFIAMDYASGQPLSHYTERDRLLPVASVYALLAEVAEALDYAHSKGVVHRDVKPANLIYDVDTDSVKITDFGIARIGDTRRTSTGTVLGSPSYMAPEQFAGGAVQGTADIFSLGVTFYQLLTGRLPFSADNVAQLAYQISQGRHPDVRRIRPDLPGSASRIVNKALAKKPADRYQSGREMAEALRRSAPKRKAG